MTSSTEPYAVIGATGQQGGAVVDALLTAGAPARALVRDPEAAGSTALAQRGVGIVTADQDDPDSLQAAMTDVCALFVMTTFAGPQGTDGEIEHGKAIVDAAVRAGVARVVYASVGGAERGTGIPHFESKRRIEEYLESGALPYSFVRPTFFYENLTRMTSGTDEDEIVLRLPMPGDVALQMVAARDIGAVCAAVLLDPSVLPGHTIEIAGDELTGEQMAAQIGYAHGKPARYEALALDALDDPDQRAMFRWFVDSSAYHADFAATRALDPDVLDLASWLDHSGGV